MIPHIHTLFEFISIPYENQHQTLNIKKNWPGPNQVSRVFNYTTATINSTNLVLYHLTIIIVFYSLSQGTSCNVLSCANNGVWRHKIKCLCMSNSERAQTTFLAYSDRFTHVCCFGTCSFIYFDVDIQRYEGGSVEIFIYI